MKNLFVFLFFCTFYFFSFSQVITIEFEKSYLLITGGEVSPEKLISDSLNAYDMGDGTYKKVFNLDSMWCEFYVNNELYTKLDIFKVEKDSNNRTKITFLESDLRNGNPLYTIQLIDDKMSYYYWYWDGYDNTSNMICETISKTTIK